MRTKILLKNIQIYGYHGVLPEERIIGTNYILNLELNADVSKATETDALEDTLNYAAVNEIIREEMAIPSNLIEHAAGRIFRRLRGEFNMLIGIKMELLKTNPPMPGECEGAAILLEDLWD